MLSTPQKVLRDTLRERIDSSSSKDASSHPDIDGNNNNISNNNNNSHHVDESTTDEDDDRGMEMRREALRQRGRESYAKRKESSIVGTNTAPVITRGSRRTGASESFMDRINAISNDDDDDDEDEDDDDGEDIFFNESKSKLRPDNEKKPPQPRKKRKSDIGNGEPAYVSPDNVEGTETEEDEPYLEPEPGSGKRKASSSQRPPMDSSPQLPMRQASPPRIQATRVNSTSTTGTVVSRFKEGSMRNRASVVPPVEIIGKLPSSSSPPRHDDDRSNGIGGESNAFSFGGATEKPGAEAMAAAAAGNSGGSFTFGGISSLVPFNPFKFVKGIRESWDRQKRFHEEREQQKKELRERKIKGLLAYEEFKRMGALQGYAGNAAAVMGAQGRAKNSASTLGPIRVEHDQIAKAFGTDQQSSPLARSSSKVRRKKRTTRTPSVGGDANMTGMAQSFCEGREAYVDENGTLHRYSVDSRYMSPQGSFNRRNISKPITPKTGAMGPPPPIPSSRANGGNFEDARVLPKKKSSVFSVFGGRNEDSKELQKLKRQEQLQKKVSNLEDQLERARRELEITIDQQSASRRKRMTPISGTAASRVSVMSARESAMSPSMSDETDEGDKTEVDEDNGGLLSPLANAGSIGGSFMAKTAGMTIVEKTDEQAQQQQEVEPPLPDIPIPKKASKSGLGGRRRVTSSSAAGSSSVSATAAALKHQGSMPAISRVRKGSSRVESVPPVPKFTNGG